MKKAKLFFLIFAIGLGGRVTPGVCGVILIDGTAAVVAKGLITVQDAHFYSALQHFRDGQPIPQTVEQGDELRNRVQKLALDQMVIAEMKSLDVQINESDEAKRLLQEQKAKGREAEWGSLLSRYGKTESEALALLEQSLEVDAFLQKKVETLTPIITDAEVDRYFSQNPKRFQGSDPQALRPSVVMLLKKQKMQKGLEDWVKGLKEKYGVTNLLNG